MPYPFDIPPEDRKEIRDLLITAREALDANSRSNLIECIEKLYWVCDRWGLRPNGSAPAARPTPTPYDDPPGPPALVCPRCQQTVRMERRGIPRPGLSPKIDQFFICPGNCGYVWNLDGSPRQKGQPSLSGH